MMSRTSLEAQHLKLHNRFITRLFTLPFVEFNCSSTSSFPGSEMRHRPSSVQLGELMAAVVQTQTSPPFSPVSATRTRHAVLKSPTSGDRRAMLGRTSRRHDRRPQTRPPLPYCLHYACT